MTENILLVPIRETLQENEDFRNNPLCHESLFMSIEFFQKVGFVPPWIGYYVKKGHALVGSCAFKGPPVNGAVEIAYGVFEKYRNRGLGRAICRKLIDLALKTDPSITITARTLPVENFSTKILKKNNFFLRGMVNDPEDGEVWEWVFQLL